MEDSFFSSKSPTKNNEINTIKKSKNNLINEDKNINEDQNNNDNKSENKNKDEDERSEISENEMKISVKKEVLNSAYTVEDACELIKNVFTAAGEREISVGDGVDIWIVRNNDNIDNNSDDNNIENDNTDKDEINHNIDNINNNSNKNNGRNDHNNGNNISQLKNNPFRKSGLFHVEKRFISLSKS